MMSYELMWLCFWSTTLSALHCSETKLVTSTFSSDQFIAVSQTVVCHHSGLLCLLCRIAPGILAFWFVWGTPSHIKMLTTRRHQIVVINRPLSISHYKPLFINQPSSICYYQPAVMDLLYQPSITSTSLSELPRSDCFAIQRHLGSTLSSKVLRTMGG